VVAEPDLYAFCPAGKGLPFLLDDVDELGAGQGEGRVEFDGVLPSIS
jgi:hypothetical protein